MPKPMLRSHGFRKAHRITSKKRNVIHYTRAKPRQPSCALCSAELNGISVKGGRSRRSNSRLFGGVLCARCTAQIVTLGSRVEQSELKLNDIGMKQRRFVLQLVAH